MFVQRLRIDPDTGYGSGVAVYDLFSLPGAALWPEDELLSQAGPAALHYLTAEHDHRDSWLGTDTDDSRAEAGYAALAILHRNSDLDALQHDRWASWIGAVLAHAHLRENPEFESAISELFNRVVEHASVELASVITRLVRASLAARRGSWRIPHVASMLPPSLHQVLLDLACEINSALDEHAVDESDNNAPSPSAPVADPITAAEQPIPPLTTRQDRQEAIDAWAALLYQPLAAHTPAAVQLATGILARRDDIDHATAAGRALLISDATGSWPQVHAAVGESAEFAKQLAIACASVEYHNSRSGGTALLETLDDEELTNAYLWIASVCPPDTEEFRRGFQAATDEHQLHQWRNRLLQTLSERGTAAAVNGIGAISAVYPDDLRIKEARVTARRRAQARGTLRLTPIEVISLLNDPRKRVLNTALQLAELIRDTLEEIDRDLFTHGHLLWDRERLPVPDDAPPRTKRQLAWRPKPEGTLAAYISHELKLRLERRDIVVNREVVVRPTDEGDSGERPDILVESTTDDPNFAHPKIIAVPIEIKGSWHEAVLDAQRSQLVDQYLIATHSDAGVYLVGWYPFELWDAEDDAAKRKARRHGTPDKLQSLLSEQAIQIRKETRKHTIPFIVTVTRPASATLTDDLDAKQRSGNRTSD